MNIILFTATGAENLGDELITLCEIEKLSALNKETKITLFSHSVERTQRFLISQKISLQNIILLEYFPNGVKEKPLRNIIFFYKTLKALYHCDKVYIGGGGLFYSKNDEGHSPLLLWWLRVTLVKFFKKQITYLSLGISASAEELKPYAKGLFSKTTISVRDKKSQEILQELGFQGMLLPDPVLNYIGETNKHPESKTIGIAFRKGFVDDTVTTNIIRKLINLGYEIFLLPHSLHPADEASHDGYYLQNFLLPGVMTSQTIEQTLETYKKCHIIISMRLHSMILAIDHGIPFVGISYSKKTAILLSESGWNYSYGKEVQVDEIISTVQKIESEYDILIQKLKNIHHKFREAYSHNFKDIAGK